MEITETDLVMVGQMFKVLSQAAEVKGVWEVKIVFKSNGGDAVTIGFGDQGVPAILDIKDGTPTPVSTTGRSPYVYPTYPFTINQGQQSPILCNDSTKNAINDLYIYQDDQKT